MASSNPDASGALTCRVSKGADGLGSREEDSSGEEGVVMEVTDVNITEATAGVALTEGWRGL